MKKLSWINCRFWDLTTPVILSFLLGYIFLGGLSILNAAELAELSEKTESIFIEKAEETSENPQNIDYIPPKKQWEDSWTLIMLPDLQSYSKFERNQPITELMTCWIHENIEPLNIKMVAVTGDMVEQNNIPKPTEFKNGNQSSEEQWKAVSKAFERLDGSVPYALAVGNHDFGIRSSENRETQLKNYFTPERNSALKGVLVSRAKNAFGVETLENAAYEFCPSGNKDGQKFLLISLEFKCRDAVLDWAKELVGRDEYKDHFVILLTHSYLMSNNKRIVNENYPLKDGNYGEAVWKKLIEPSSNIQMMLCGHIGETNSFRGHVGYRVDKNAAGKNVHQILFNAQANGGGWFGNGGDGWLRILEFSGDGKKISVRTFSPFFAISPATQRFAWRTAPFDEYIIDVENQPLSE